MYVLSIQSNGTTTFTASYVSTSGGGEAAAITHGGSEKSTSNRTIFNEDYFRRSLSGIQAYKPSGRRQENPHNGYLLREEGICSCKEKVNAVFKESNSEILRHLGLL